MSETIFTFGPAKKAGRRPKTVGVKYIIQDNGERQRIYTVSSNSPNLDEDLLYVFQKSIQHERRENKRLLGSYSGLPKRKQRTSL